MSVVTPTHTAAMDRKSISFRLISRPFTSSAITSTTAVAEATVHAALVQR